jgi:hypothetical protein
VVLLCPELLEGYSASILAAAKQQPDGLGCLLESDILTGRIPLIREMPITNDQERLILSAALEDLVRQEIAVREDTEDGCFLVFPSELAREDQDTGPAGGSRRVFQFEGPIQNVYATLVVRLSHCGAFGTPRLWKNAAAIPIQRGGRAVLDLNDRGDGSAELTVSCDDVVSGDSRRQLEEYVRLHLERRGVPGSVRSRFAFSCPACGVEMHMELVRRWLQRGSPWIPCPVCEARVPTMASPGVDETLSAAITEMDRNADERRDSEAGRICYYQPPGPGRFDVFLSYNSGDRQAVSEIAIELKKRGIRPWLDTWELKPGTRWIVALQEQIGNVGAAAVFVGPSGLGPWQDIEQQQILNECVRRRAPVIPVILAGCSQEPELPPFLRLFTWVDFRSRASNPMDRLVWGITGVRETRTQGNG